MSIKETINNFIDRWREAPTRDNWRENNWVRVGVVLVLLGMLTVIGFNLVYDFTPLDKLSSQAIKARMADDNKTALKLYKIISARASDIDFSSNFELGNILLEMKHYSTAEKYYLRASNNPSAPISVYYQLSDLYLRHLQKKQQSFITLLKQRIVSQPTHEGFVIVLASFYQQIGNKTEAIVWYEQALKLDPSNLAVAASIQELKASL